MINFIRFLYSWLLPPGVFLLTFLLSYHYYCKTGETNWFYLVLAVIYFLSTQIVADTIIKPLEYYYQQVPLNTIKDAKAIIVLTGGYNKEIPDFDGKGQIASTAANRFIMCLRLHNSLHLPVIITGSKKETEIAERTLKSCGIKEQDLIVENHSHNTFENTIFTAQLCRQLKISTAILVTSASHLPRSVALFKREKLNVIPYPSDYKSNRFPKTSLLAFAPSAVILCNSATAIKEYLGILAIKLKLR